MAQTKKDVLREVDENAIRQARTLLRSARHGALATLDPATGAPIATRVATATDAVGNPIILISALSAHTAALKADPRCSLLLGEPGKGDPLAHPRITITAQARLLGRDEPAGRHARRRYLNRHPKAELYVDFPDFDFFLLEPRSASLNGGFGKAYAMAPEHLLVRSDAVSILNEAEQAAVDHMNADHGDAVNIYAQAFASQSAGPWRMTGLDVEGFDLALGDNMARVWFEKPVEGTSAMRAALIDLVAQGRRKIETA